MSLLHRSPLITLALSATLLSSAWADDPPMAPAATPSAATTATSPPQQKLDLAPPDIRKVVPGDELDTPLPDYDDPDANSVETVRVKSEHPGPDIPPGFASLWWGMWHPLSAWRLLAPIPGE